MTLEEAIAHAEQQAIRYEKEAKRKREYGGKFYDDEVQACLICAEQHRQLAEWLKELAERREKPEEAIPVSWIEARIKRFMTMDNAFSGLTASIIRVMLNEWKREQEGETI